MDDEAIEALIQSLRQGPRQARRAAAQALYDCADARAVPALAAALNEFDTCIRRSAARALNRIHDLPAAQALIGALVHKDPHLKRYAARCLSDWPDPAVAAALIDALWQSEDQACSRPDIAHILSRHHDPAVIDALLEPLRNPSGNRWQRRLLAASTLRDMANSLTAAGLMTLVRSPYIQAYERGSAIKAMVGLSLPEVTDFLIALFASEAFSDQQLRPDAAYALGECRAHESVPVLLDYLARASGPNDRLIVIKALGKIGDPRAVPALLEALNQYAPQSKHIRKQAARALARFADPEIVRTVARDLQDPSADRRARAAWALGEMAQGEIRLARALPALRLALDDADARVRDLAAKAIRRIDQTRQPRP